MGTFLWNQTALWLPEDNYLLYVLVPFFFLWPHAFPYIANLKAGMVGMLPKAGGPLLSPNSRRADSPVRKWHINASEMGPAPNIKRMCYNKHHLWNTSSSKALYI